MSTIRFNEQWLKKATVKEVRATFKSNKRQLDLALAKRAELLKK
jgi:hypothetical protein